MAILDDALSYVGKIDYSFGANDIPGGSGDCSAFTQYIFNQNGYTIGRDTRSQLNSGSEVAKGDLKPGDLVFFQGTYREGVSHVGIYIGNGKMVNLQGDGCKVDDITSGYWAEHYMTARRVAAGGDVGIPDLDNYNDYIADDVIMSGGGSTDFITTGVKDWFASKLSTIVTVVCIIGVCLLAVFFIFKALQSQITIPTIDDLGDALNNVGGVDNG